MTTSSAGNKMILIIIPTIVSSINTKIGWDITTLPVLHCLPLSPLVGAVGIVGPTELLDSPTVDEGLCIIVAVGVVSHECTNVVFMKSINTLLTTTYVTGNTW